jgi:NADH-quinone oxidoreductase chain I
MSAPMPQTTTSTAATGPGLPEPLDRVRPYRYGLAERLYLWPIVKGLGVTIRHFFKNLWKSPHTISYPEERRAYSGRYRGHHILTTRPDGSVRCVACFLCATNCPAECIHIEAAEQPDVNIEKYPVVYEIDMLRCIFCGFCVDACPEEAIIMSRNTDMAYFVREQSIVGKADLMKPYTVDKDRLGYRPYYPEEERRRARMRTDAFNLVSAARGERQETSEVVAAAHG